MCFIVDAKAFHIPQKSCRIIKKRKEVESTCCFSQQEAVQNENHHAQFGDSQ